MIFTDRTITIKDNESTIDKKVTLYRGDKEVEIRFAIVDSQYKYKTNGTVNVIETTEASWAQLVIMNTSNSQPLISEIAPTSDGKVILNISAEMIDEITEVGNYTFQIRLFDEDKTSRITIPEVIEGIVVKEPLSVE